MVICKYFLRGSCRFGENCKNEHSYNENPGSIIRKKQDIDPNIIIKSVSNDMDKAENGHQWPFSCYGPFQGKPCFPGFEDKSFEEIRLGLIEADKNGTGEQYKLQLVQLLNEIRMKMRSLLNPTPEATKMLQELFNSNTENQNMFINTSNNLFPNSTNSTSIFSNNQNVFQNQSVSNPSSNQSIFTNQPVSNSNSNQSIFSNQQVSNSNSNFNFAVPENKSIFGNNQISSGSIFSQNNQTVFPSSQNSQTGFLASQNNQTAFTPSQNNQTAFTPSQNTQTGFASNIFGGGNSIFANAQQNFASNTNLFPNNQNFANTGSLFGQQNQFIQQAQSGGSIFNQQSDTVDANNPFKNTQFIQNNAPEPPNPFQQNTDPFKQNMDAFKQNTNEQNNYQLPQNIFQQSPFSSNFGQLQAQEISQTSLVDHTKSIFGSNIGSQTQLDTRRQDDTTIYSKLEDLTEKEIKTYEAATFEFGKIPVNPPTLQMC